MDATQIREQWLKLMGFDPEEIAEDIAMYPPTNLEAELKELEAAKRIKVLNGEAIQ